MWRVYKIGRCTRGSGGHTEGVQEQTLSPGEAAELSELLRAVYGRDAGGAPDAATLSRLRELEARAAAARLPADAGADEEEADAPPPADPPPDLSEPPALPAAASIVPTAVRRSWLTRRRRRMGAIAMATLLGGAVGVAGAAVALAPPQPDEVLRPVTGAAIPPYVTQSSIFGYVGADRDNGIVAYEARRGIQTYTFVRTTGERCLLVDVDAGYTLSACGRGSVDPLVDIYPGQGGPEMLEHGLTDGALVRVVARDGVVELWVEEAPPDPT